MKRITLAAVLAVFGTGCASIVKPKESHISFATGQQCSGQIECTVKHKKGEYKARPTEQITVQKSDDPLEVVCRDKGGNEYHTDSIKGARGAMAWGNIVFGGGIGGIVDAHTDAHWDYPQNVQVPCPKG